MNEKFFILKFTNGSRFILLKNESAFFMSNIFKKLFDLSEKDKYVFFSSSLTAVYNLIKKEFEIKLSEFKGPNLDRLKSNPVFYTTFNYKHSNYTVDYMFAGDERLLWVLNSIVKVFESKIDLKQDKLFVVWDNSKKGAENRIEFLDRWMIEC